MAWVWATRLSIPIQHQTAVKNENWVQNNVNLELMKKNPPDSPLSFKSFIAVTSGDLSPNDQEERMTPRLDEQWEPPSPSDISQPGSPALDLSASESQTTLAIGSQGIWKRHDRFYLLDGNAVFRVRRFSSLSRSTS
jgi:hypothetical protein